MNLSDYDEKYFQVKRDGIFGALGLVQTKLSKPLLCFALSENYLKLACNNPDISCIICTKDIAENNQLLESEKGIAVCERPDVMFTLLHNDLVKNNDSYTNKYTETKIGSNCYIHPMASIDKIGVTIGNNVKVEEFAVIRKGTYIGDNSIIRSNTVIGVEHYDLCWDNNRRIIKMQESGEIYIDENVEIGSNTNIGRGTFPYQVTTIGKNTCVDGDTVISHNCKIGANCFIARSHICGSVIVKDGVRINPMVTIKNSITIGENATITLGAVVVRNVPAGERVSGNFAIEHSKFLKNYLQSIRNR